MIANAFETDNEVLCQDHTIFTVTRYNAFRILRLLILLDFVALYIELQLTHIFWLCLVCHIHFGDSDVIVSVFSE